MRRPRDTAVAIALLCCALAAAGCGFGPGDQVGAVELTVTRDFGATPIAGPLSDQISESDTVMRVLDRNAGVSTRYGGAFVQAIEGLAGGREDGHPYDWFFYVNGLWAPVGAADYRLHGGEAIWWDYRDWSESLRVPALVGSWPQPFAGGYEGERHPTSVVCRTAGAVCDSVRQKLRAAGAALVGGVPKDAIRVLVGPWSRLRADPVAAEVEAGPRRSGVFAEIEVGGDGFELWGLDESGDRARRFDSRAGMVAALRQGDSPPVWLVTGTSLAGVRAAAGLLDAAALRDRYAVAVDGGEQTSLPVGSG
jgi:hypothetical protein